MGRVLSLKFEDWDLMDHDKFPHLATSKLMRLKKNTIAGAIELEPHKCLHKLKKAGLLDLLWVPHYHHALVTIFVIR